MRKARTGFLHANCSAKVLVQYTIFFSSILVFYLFIVMVGGATT